MAGSWRFVEPASAIEIQRHEAVWICSAKTKVGEKRRGPEPARSLDVGADQLWSEADALADRRHAAMHHRLFGLLQNVSRHGDGTLSRRRR